MNKWFLAAAAVVGMGVLAGPVQATLIKPGDAPSPLTPLTTLPAGSIVSNGGHISSISFVALDPKAKKPTPSLTATLYFAVYKEAASGFLDFLYQIQIVKKGSQDAILKQVISNVRGAAFYLDTAYLRPTAPIPPGFLRNPRGETPPTSASLSKDGTAVTFSFTKNFGPGMTSNVFMIRTHAKSFKKGNSDIITRETSTNLPTFAPGPEPSSLVLFAGCFLGLAGWTGWRRWQRGGTPPSQ